MAKRREQPLAEYRKKRRFAVTPEPSGTSAKSPSKQPIFCVQKHLARTLHYDFRLEHNGVLLSWAVPKGPSLNPMDKRFAARTEDHPREYGDFEGVIPEGYGAGIVMLWDRGTWECETGDVDAAIQKGEIKMRLEAVKLKGSWVLVRTKPGADNKEHWLLIKHKDHWSGALDVTTLAPQSVKTFGNFVDILRAATIPETWRKRLPVHGGHTGVILRRIVREAGTQIPQEPALTRVAKLAASTLQFGSKLPKLTNLDKVLYPNGFTKGEVIDYYTRIAPFMLPHLIGRAVTFTRYPDGVGRKSFFQKRCPEHRPRWVNTVRIIDSGDAIDYCEIGDISTLVWVANLAALEIHAPLALAEAPDTPTAMVFDLDPGEPAGLTECIDVARRIAAVLKQMRLESFAKFSGKKGVHLLVPLNARNVTFDQTKLFARALAQVMVRDDPNHITAVMRKEERRGKVFIDWNQNDRSKTMVCAYSLRAESSPRISWPINLEAPSTPPSADDLSIPPVDPLEGMHQLRQELPVDTSWA